VLKTVEKTVSVDLLTKVILCPDLYFFSTGVGVVPGAISVKLVYLGVYFTAVTLCAAYSATLVSSLAVQKNVLPFKNFQQMLKRNDFEMGVVNNSAVLGEFEVSLRSFA
jgi:hypothetical protein